MLTQINFDFGHPRADGVAVLAGELVHVVPTGRFKVGKRIVVRDYWSAVDCRKAALPPLTFRRPTARSPTR